ncbi:MAG: hypothetical protein WDZ44_01490 [Candidatus Spechtbacterales bacterium]
MSLFRSGRNRRFNAVIRPKKERSFVPRMPALFARVPSGVVIGISVAGVGAVALLSIIFFSGQFAVQTISAQGSSEEGNTILEAEVASWTSQKLLGFIPRATLLFPASSLEEHLFRIFPRLKSIEVKAELPHGVSLVVQERARDGIWCAAQGTINPHCFFYGEDGVIFEEAPNNARGFLLRFVRDERRPTATAGERVLSDEDLMDLEVLYSAFASGFEAPSYVVLASDEEARIGFLPNWEARLSRDDDFIPQVENIALVIAHRVKDRRGELEYIDARLGSRLFYKYQSAPAPVSVPDTTPPEAPEETPLN